MDRKTRNVVGISIAGLGTIAIATVMYFAIPVVSQTPVLSLVVAPLGFFAVLVLMGIVGRL